MVLGFETLTDVHWTMSGLVVLMTLVGGMGTMVGPILGAFLIITLENKLGDLGAWLAETLGIEWFATLGESVGMVIGLIFIVCVLLFRRGIVGEIGALFNAAARPPEAHRPGRAVALQGRFSWSNAILRPRHRASAAGSAGLNINAAA